MVTITTTWLQRCAKIKTTLANGSAGDDCLCTLISFAYRSKAVTHLPTNRSKGKNSHSGFVFSRRKHLLSGIFVKAVFASMACARKQMTVEEKNAILSMLRQCYSSRKIAEIFTRCNSTFSRLVKRCDETRSKENRSRHTHCLGKNIPGFIRCRYDSLPRHFRSVLIQKGHVTEY